MSLERAHKEKEPPPSFKITVFGPSSIVETRNITTGEVTSREFSITGDFDRTTNLLKDLLTTHGQGTHDANTLSSRLQATPPKLLKEPSLYKYLMLLNHTLPPEALEANIEYNDASPKGQKLTGTVSIGNIEIERSYRHHPSKEPPKTREKIPKVEIPNDLTGFDHVILTIADQRFYLDINQDLPETLLVIRILDQLTNTYFAPIERPLDLEAFKGALWSRLSENEQALFSNGPKTGPNIVKEKTLAILTSVIRSLKVTNKLNQVINRPQISISADPPDETTIEGLGVIFPPGTDKSKLRGNEIREAPNPKRVEEAKTALQAITDPSLLNDETRHGIAHNMVSLARTKEGKHALMEALKDRVPPITYSLARYYFDLIAKNILDPDGTSGGYDAAVDTYTMSGGRVIPGRSHTRGHDFVTLVSGRASARTKPNQHILNNWVVRAGYKPSNT